MESRRQAAQKYQRRRVQTRCARADLSKIHLRLVRGDVQQAAPVWLSAGYAIAGDRDGTEAGGDDCG